MVREKGKRIAILVAGTHGSGAPLLARVLELLGCDLPKADAAGESEHRGAAHAIALNDRILASAGTAWDDWAAFDPKWNDSRSAREFHAFAQAMLQGEFETSRLFALEDPRICRLLPFWIGALEAFGAEPRIVSLLRNPLDVAASLEARGEIDAPTSHLLWLRHALDAEAASRGFKRAWLRYETLLAGPQAAMNALGNALDLSWPKCADRDVWIEIEGLLCHERRHRRSDDSRTLENPALSHWLRSSFEIFERWSRDEGRQEDTEALDRIRSTFDAAVPMFHRALAARGERIEALHRQVAERDSEIEGLRGSGGRRPGRAVRRAGRARASAAASFHRIARRLFFAAPLPPALQYRLLRRYHRYMGSRRARSSREGGFFAPEEDHGEKRSRALPIPHDGRWSPEAFAEHHGALRSLAAALASPEEDGPLHESDLDIDPAREGPLVTIVVRSYAGRWPLAKAALESIAAQSYRPIEVVVAEDGPGEMAAMIDSLDGGEGCQFRHVATGIKAGRSAAANLGLAHANGTFVGFLDDDDRLMEHHCGVLVSCLLKHAHVDAAYAASEEVEARHDETRSRMADNGNMSIFFKPMASSAMLYSDNYFPIQAVLFRRTLLSPASRFDKNLDAVEDWLFWMSVLPGRGVAPVAEITSRFHVPYGSTRARRQRLHRAAEGYLDIQRKALWAFQRLTNIGLIDEHANYSMHRAWQRARLPMAKGDKHSGSGNGETPLERALGAAPSRPSTTPKFDRRIVAYTSINLRYLPKALAWAQSVKQHSPDWETHILLNDAPPDGASFWPHVDVVYPVRNLDIPSLHSWLFAHDVEELCTATKPFYAKHLLDSGYDYVFYLDPDTRVYRDLDILLSEMEGCDVLLTPHCAAEAIRDSEILHSEISTLAHGVFNLGFIGFKQSPTAHRVASFWKRRLLTHCMKDHARGLWTDQKWLNLAPIYFDGVKICRHKGCNTASWNIAHRTIGRKSGQWTAGGEPLIFFHFSGYDRNVPRTMFDIFGKFNGDLERLIAEYDDIVSDFSSSHKEWKSAWAYGYYDNGEEVPNSHRQYYRNRRENMLVFPQPFYTRGDRSWLEYLKWLGDDHIAEWTDSATRLRRYY